MNPEEFLDFIRRSDADIKEAIKNEKACLKKLSEELFNFIFQHFPEYEPYRTSIAEQLKELCNDCAVQIIEKLNTARFSHERNSGYKHHSQPPKVTSKSESHKELQDLTNELKGIKEVTKEDLAYLEKIHWEDYNHEIKHQQFHKGLHDKAKEVLVEFYEEIILELKSDYLRMLDDYTYALAINPFIDEVYGVLPTLEKIDR